MLRKSNHKKRFYLDVKLEILSLKIDFSLNVKLEIFKMLKKLRNRKSFILM